MKPIRAGIAQTIKDSQFTSARLRLQTIADAVQDAVGSGEISNGSAVALVSSDGDSISDAVDSFEYVDWESPSRRLILATEGHLHGRCPRTPFDAT